MLPRIIYYAQLMRLDKPIGTLLLLWPTLWALWLAAKGFPPIKILIIFLLGTFIMRSAGCVINDYADQRFDREVTRTKQRPLAMRRITNFEAIFLFIMLTSFAAGLAWQLNALALKLAVIGLLITILYPFTKRFFIMPQFILGFAFAWGIPMGFATILNALPPICWLLFFTTLLWIIVYDTLYAMVDREDDKKIGIYSSALWFSQSDRFIIAILQSIILILLAWLSYLQHLGITYLLSLVVVIGLFIYQQFLIKDRQPQQCFQAFLNNHWVGCVIFLGIAFS